MSDSNTGIDIRQQGQNLIVEFLKTSLPEKLRRQLDVTDYGTPVAGVVSTQVGNTVRMVPVEEVIYFEAADKYVRVLTTSHEYLIRTPLRDVLPRLDAQQFWQIHRSTLVNVKAIASVTRDFRGRQIVSVRKMHWPKITSKQVCLTALKMLSKN